MTNSCMQIKTRSNQVKPGHGLIGIANRKPDLELVDDNLNNWKSGVAGTSAAAIAKTGPHANIIE